MQKLETLSKAIAKGLYIQVSTLRKNEDSTYTHIFEKKSVSDEIRRQFETALVRQMTKKIKKCDYGTTLVYAFNIISPVIDFALRSITSEGSYNIDEVLTSLPELPDGESYEFPYDTYIILEVIDKNNVESLCMCNWISQAFFIQFMSE